MSEEPLLDVDGLQASFLTDDGVVPAVDRISFSLQRGRVLGIVGESGSGKSVSALALMRLLPPSASVAGRVTFMGRSMLDLSESELQQLRGRDIAMIFQDPMTSLNPFHTIGWQLREAVTLHKTCSKSAAHDRAVELLAEVDISEPEARMRSYPHELSGGMRQRVMIAMAAVHRPAVLIADEPTTALDVTTQMQILALLGRLRDEAGTAIVLITHDLGLVAELCEDVLVMYAGRVVEQGPVERIFGAPQHPYTWGLLSSLPSRAAGGRLAAIPGYPPSQRQRPGGCPFHPRCAWAMDVCSEQNPELVHTPSDDSHFAACHLPFERREALSQTITGSPGAL